MAITTLLNTHVAGKLSVIHILILCVGTLFPILLGMVLPRRRTIQYGMWINKTLGLALLQKRLFRSVPSNIAEGIIHAIQTTFQDVSFGVYIDARKDLTLKEKQKKINEYLNRKD